MMRHNMYNNSQYEMVFMARFVAVMGVIFLFSTSLVYAKTFNPQNILEAYTFVLSRQSALEELKNIEGPVPVKEIKVIVDDLASATKFIADNAEHFTNFRISKIEELEKAAQAVVSSFKGGTTAELTKALDKLEELQLSKAMQKKGVERLKTISSKYKNLSKKLGVAGTVLEVGGAIYNTIEWRKAVNNGASELEKAQKQLDTAMSVSKIAIGVASGGLSVAAIAAAEVTVAATDKYIDSLGDSVRDEVVQKQKGYYLAINAAEQSVYSEIKRRNIHGKSLSRVEIERLVDTKIDAIISEIESSRSDIGLLTKLFGVSSVNESAIEYAVELAEALRDKSIPKRALKYQNKVIEAEYIKNIAVEYNKLPKFDLRAVAQTATVLAQNEQVTFHNSFVHLKPRRNYLAAAKKLIVKYGGGLTAYAKMSGSDRAKMKIIARNLYGPGQIHRKATVRLVRDALRFKPNTQPVIGRTDGWQPVLVTVEIPQDDKVYLSAAPTNDLANELKEEIAPPKPELVIDPEPQPDTDNEISHWTGSVTGVHVSPASTFSVTAGGRIETTAIPTTGDRVSIRVRHNLGVETVQGTVRGRYQYTSWGDWNGSITVRNNGIGQNATLNGGLFILGQPTPRSYIDQKTGSASYAGNLIGDFGSQATGILPGSVHGTVNMTANFNSRVMSGNLNMSGPNGFSANPTFSANFVNQGQAVGYEGNLNSATANGGINGIFFGPTAQETGGSFWYVNGSGEATGTFRAKQ